MAKSKKQKIELYKITARYKKHLYESKAAFEKGWKLHSQDDPRFVDVVAYRLTKNMTWNECRRIPANYVQERLPPQAYYNGKPVSAAQFHRLEKLETLDAILSGTLK